MNNSSTSFVSHIFGEKVILQTLQDTKLGNKTIPSGYCNLTQMCNANGKKYADYKRLKSTSEYINALSADMGIPISQVVVEVQASGDEQGTWGHIEVAIDLARWVSVDFRIWSNRVLWCVIKGDFKPLTDEAEQAKIKLDAIWKELREVNKESFWGLGGAIDEYIEEHIQTLSDNYLQWIYPNCQNCINKGLFGKSAKTIREELGTSDLLRDHYSREALKRIEMIQRVAAQFIRKDNQEPLASVKLALDTLKFEVINYN